MLNARLDEAQTGIKISGRNIINLRYADMQICRNHPYGRKWRRTNELLDESERGELKKADLKFNIYKMKMMVFGPITSWHAEKE